MKILFDNIIFSLQKAGGISVVWSEILSHLSKEQGIDLSLIEYRNSNIFRKNINIPLTVKIFNKRILPLPFLRYCDVNIPEQEGIFHSSYYRVATSKKIKNMTTVHDFTYEYYRKGLPKSIHSFQKIHAFKKSEGIICVSENTKNDLLYFNLKIDESKVKVIYNGVTGMFFKKNSLQDLKFTVKEWFTKYGQLRAEVRNNFFRSIDLYYNPNYQIEVFKRVLL